MDAQQYDNLLFGRDIEEERTSPDELQQIALSLLPSPSSLALFGLGQDSAAPPSHHDLLALSAHAPFYFQEKMDQTDAPSLNTGTLQPFDNTLPDLVYNSNHHHQQQQQQYQFENNAVWSSSNAFPNDSSLVGGKGEGEGEGEDDMLLAFQLEQLQQMEQLGRADAGATTPSSISSSTAANGKMQAPAAEADNDAEEIFVDESRSVWTLTELEIGYMDFQQLVRMIAAEGLNSRQEEDFKALRRKVRNRKSARECSTRKRHKAKTLAVVNVELEEKMMAMQRTIEALTSENTTLRRQNLVLSKANVRHEQEVESLRNQVEALTAALQQNLSFAGAA